MWSGLRMTPLGGGFSIVSQDDVSELVTAPCFHSGRRHCCVQAVRMGTLMAGLPDSPPTRPMLSTSAALHLLPYLASAAVSAGVGAYCWARRARPGVGAFAVMAFAQAAWTLGLVFELAAPGPRGGRG